MENQHHRITGYRELLPAEVDLINQIKTGLTAEITLHLGLVRAHIDAQRNHPSDVERINAANPERWLAMARTDFQTALMALVRAVAQPAGL